VQLRFGNLLAGSIASTTRVQVIPIIGPKYTSMLVWWVIQPSHYSLSIQVFVNTWEILARDQIRFGLKNFFGRKTVPRSFAEIRIAESLTFLEKEKFAVEVTYKGLQS